MDETLIHCVDDIETEDPDVILSILFPDEDEPVNVSQIFNLIWILGWNKYSTIYLWMLRGS